MDTVKDTLMSSRACALFFAIATAAGMWAQQTYTVTLIGAGSGGPLVFTNSYTANGINDSGQVVGGFLWRTTGAHCNSFLYSSGGLVADVSRSSGGATAINNAGQIVGGWGCPEAQGSPFLYTGGNIDNGFDNGALTAINDSGEIVGQSTVGQSGLNGEAVLYSGGVKTLLGFLPGGANSIANGINNSGQIVGYSGDTSFHGQAFLYTGGVMSGLGFLPGETTSAATAINEHGQIVGYSGAQAFLYTGGVMTGLGTLPGDVSSQALAINSKGQVVGYSAGAAYGSDRAFLYSGGQVHDLNSLAGNPQDTLTAATGINASGQIIANSSSGSAYLLTPIPQGRFVPVTPCRIADTRTAPGSFGGPALAGGAARSFPVPESACGIPATAQAYSLNVTVVPQGPLGYLTLWPTGMEQPLVSTLNSFQGSVVANAAIVPAGQNGAVSVYVTDPTDLILDIDGYFDATSGDSFYTVPPCRLADTRLPANSSTDTLHGPSMGDHETRDFPVLSTSCGLPATASAYSTNVTVIPAGLLSFLTTWATGQPQPLVSTLNALNGGIVANAAIVPAGTNGAVSVYVTNKTDVVLDTNGYFAPSGNSRALTFYPVTPCRVADTREADGPFGGPVLKGGTLRSFAIPDSDCSIPATAAAYSLNVTAVPDGPLGFLTAWPTGLPLPFVSTLNSPTGTVTANAAIVPAGANGAISVYVTNQTHVVLDINGYFAP